MFRFNKSIKELLERPQGENPEEIRKAELKVQEAQAALDSLKKAEAELKAAIDELQAQETAYNNKIAELDRKSKDQSATVVARNKAANELAQLKQEDPLPLRKAKLTQEAALRKVEKQRLAAEAAVDEALKYLDQVRKQGGSPQGTLWWMVSCGMIAGSKAIFFSGPRNEGNPEVYAKEEAVKTLLRAADCARTPTSVGQNSF